MKRLLAALPLAIVLLANGAVLLVTGVLFAFWPATLAGSDFVADPSALRRLAVLLFFGGTGIVALLMGYGLLKSWPFAWRRFVDAATVIALVAIGFIWRSQHYRFLAWLILIASATSLALYLRLRRERPGGGA